VPTVFAVWTHYEYPNKLVFHLSYAARLHLEVFMTNVVSSSKGRQAWRELYSAALFESDRTRIPARIADAEHAIVARARELFSAGSDTVEEDQALDDALYALRALQSCLRLHDTAAA
jgi:hypothetical protein